MPAELLACMHITDMHLNNRCCNSSNSIGQRDGSMRKGARVKHNPVGRETGFMEFVYNGPLMVALEIRNIRLGEERAQPGQVILKGLAAINTGLPQAKQVQIRAVDNQNFHGCKIRPNFGQSKTCYTMRSRTLFLALNLFTYSFLCAQGALISDPLPIRNDYGYDLIGRLRDRILLFRDRYDNFEVQAFDSQMHLSWSKQLEDLDHRGIQVLSVTAGKNDFSVLHKVRRRGHVYLRVHKYDPNANLIDTLTVRDYGEQVFSPPSLHLVRSEDKNCMLVFNDAEPGKLQLTCFRTDRMMLLWDKTITLEQGDRYDPDPWEIALGNDGDLFYVVERNNRRNKLDNHFLSILRINSTGDQVYTVRMGEYSTLETMYQVDNLNRKLTGIGIWGDKLRSRASGVMYISVPFDGGAHTIQYEVFDDKFVSILRQKDVEENTRGISDTDIRDVVLRRDGGALLVAERHHEVQRGTVAGRGFMREGTRLVVDYYYDDMFVWAFNPDGKTHWNSVLHKKQYSQDDEGVFSSYFLHKTAGNLHFLFNDEIKYENTCSEYILSPTGIFDRNGLLNTVNQSLRLRFRDAIQLSSTETLVPSEFRNKLRLVLIRY